MSDLPVIASGWKRVLLASLAAVAALAVAAPAQATPGDLDASFGGDGKQTTDFGAGEAAYDVALQPDGKIVALGRSQGKVALARYNADGSLDESFSGDGKQISDFETEASSVALQADGKIVAAGSYHSDFALERYNDDGSLDTSFGAGGLRTTDFGGSDYGDALEIQADGKIVVVGRAEQDFAVARYDEDGTLDASFGTGGKQTTHLGDYWGGDSDSAGDVAIQEDGKIVVVGTTDPWPTCDPEMGPCDPEPPSRFALARYTADGTLDATFSGDGKETTDFASDSSASAVALQPDGQLVVAGSTGDSAWDFALARYNADGTLDASFGAGGKQTTAFGGFIDSASDVALERDGKIVVVGYAYTQGSPNFATSSMEDLALARYNADGRLDATFSGDGKQTTDFGGDSDGARGVAIHDGKIVAAGHARLSGAPADFALARYQGGSGASDPPPPEPDTTPPPEPTATPPAGTYKDPQSVSLSSEAGASIHYTTDGSEPDAADPVFDPASPIRVAESLTIKAMAIDEAGNRSPVASHAYTILPDYPKEILATSGLVSYWRLGETSGTTAADAKGASMGSYRNGVALGQQSALTHDPDPSAKFDGSNDYVSVADHASLDSGDRFTLEAWVRRSHTSSTSTHTVLSKGSGSYRLSFVNDVLTLTKAGSGTIAKASVSTTDTTGFHHVVATKSGGTVKLYIDGVDQTPAKVTNRTIANNSTALNLGRDPSGTQYFPGLVDEVAIYNAALSQAQVQQHFKASGR